MRKPTIIFSFSQPCPVQTTVIVSCCECQEDRISQMEVRKAHRKGRMIPLNARGLEEQGGQIDLHGLGPKRPGLDGDELYGLGLPPLGDRANPEALPTPEAQGKTKS